MTRLLPSLLFACLAGCTTSSDTRLPAEDEHLPTPYTAAEIRAAHPPGTEVTYSIRAAGRPPLRSVFVFGESDAESVMLGGQVLAEDGEVVQRTEPTAIRWTELRDHARFAAARTERAEASASPPAGTFDCWLYTVEDPTTGTISRYWFAKERPGSPVVMTVSAAGEEQHRMELLSVRSPR